MKFKVGDKVRVRTWEDLRRRYPSEMGAEHIRIRLGFNSDMRRRCGKVVLITKVNKDNESYKIQGSDWSWGDEMFEDYTEAEMPRKMNIVKISEVDKCDIFTIAGVDMYKICKEGDGWLCMFANPVFEHAYGSSQNYAKSEIHHRLTEEVLPDIETKVGADNLLKFTLDLKHFDNPNKYCSIETKIGILTYNQYEKIKYSDAGYHMKYMNAMLATAYSDSMVLYCVDSGASCADIARNRAIMPIVCLSDNVEVYYGG